MLSNGTLAWKESVRQFLAHHDHGRARILVGRHESPALKDGDAEHLEIARRRCASRPSHPSLLEMAVAPQPEYQKTGARVARLLEVSSRLLRRPLLQADCATASQDAQRIRRTPGAGRRRGRA